MPSDHIARHDSTRTLAGRVAVVGAALASIVLGAASCGSRTGLFVGEPDMSDSSTQIQPDAPIDAAPDVVPCVPGEFGFDLATAQLMFVLDRSGSMAFSLTSPTLPDPGEPSRWEALHDGLAEAIRPLDQQLAMGAKFYPEALSEDDLASTALACLTDNGVGIAPARGNAESILDVFFTTEPRGGTPTAEAIRLAAQYLADRRTVARTIVVATDGAPNCNGDLDGARCVCTAAGGDCRRSEYSCLDDTRTIDVIHQIAEVQKIPVFVIGLGSTERPEFLRVLDDMAVAGGRARPTVPRHYNVQSPVELRSALQTISDSIARCTYLTPSTPNDPNAIDVEINGVSIPRDTNHKNGWDWVDQAYGSLAFFGDACDRAQAATSKVNGRVSCEKD
ncbi:hypothetical protein AKJ09_09955 [Labilithrix luteola]|uniref:VWFA domain-containing protein n=1 Tax=Labilithrix luteola TaxID=1391654 RepID=A0A0K1QCB2_9BACT|nr:vWA domain-containing protein [Labilithrix luteola]AKV03292.1 hypothetical protein AKJ09_09955 [Labilithrix luteola]